MLITDAITYQFYSNFDSGKVLVCCHLNGIQNNSAFQSHILIIANYQKIGKK